MCWRAARMGRGSPETQWRAVAKRSPVQPDPSLPLRLAGKRGSRPKYLKFQRLSFPCQRIIFNLLTLNT
jgi:hypothetical protein